MGILVRFVGLGLAFILVAFPPGSWASDCATSLAHRFSSEQELELLAQVANGDSSDGLVYADFLQDRADALSLARAAAIRYRIDFDRYRPGFLQRMLKRPSFTEFEWLDLRAEAHWNDVGEPFKPNYSWLYNPDEYALLFRNGVPISAVHRPVDNPNMESPYRVSSIAGQVARNERPARSLAHAESYHTAELALWLRVPTLVHLLGPGRELVSHPFSLWGEPTVIRAAVRGVIGALHCADRLPGFYSNRFFFLLHEVMRHGFEGTLDQVSPLILKRLEAASQSPLHVRALKMVRALWYDLPTQESLSALVQVPFFPFLATPAVLEDGWMQRMETFFFFRGSRPGELPSPFARRLAERLWARLELIDPDSKDVQVWREFLAQPLESQRVSTRQIFRELLHLSLKNTESRLSLKVGFLKSAAEAEGKEWEF